MSDERRTQQGGTRLGLDVGGVFAKVVVLEADGTVRHRAARRHHGSPVSVVKEMLRELELAGPVTVGITGRYGHLVTGGLNLVPVNFVNAEIESVRRRFPDARNIINVGGSSVTLISLDEEGNFLDFSTNSLCAAGTGSFLDQQADRLGLSYDDLEAFEHMDSPPPIATRCSVFAKSDLIHRQQEGYDKPALWCGLCKSMTGTFLNTLLRGRPLNGLTVLTGGVSQNAEVMRWLKARYGDQVRTFDHAPYTGAIGAAWMTDGRVDDFDETVECMKDTSRSAAEVPRRDKLEFKKSSYPSFDVAEAYEDERGNEVRITRWPALETAAFYVGIDIGSTSTKALLMDESGEVLADIYRRTAGDPIGATRRIFDAILELGERKGTGLKVLGVATTGSGRKLVGQVVGADLIVNEITAHLRGAMQTDPRVETIFEIGGQDAKYIRAKDGRICDSNMNYVCAAGTGSFVEEQAKRLGFALDEIGDVVMGIAPPVTSDRCTVFMEQDVERLIRQGFTREECMAAVLCSVIKNYFTKVVGRRSTSRERVFFQGATARNKGLVAAFERLLDVEMIVSPYCHVMGSYGAALLAKDSVEKSDGGTTFKGLDLSKRKIALRTETCMLCQNHCKITFADIEGEDSSPSWGYLCGRDPSEDHVRVREEFNLFRKRQRMLMSERGRNPKTARVTVGLPRALTTYSLLPLWDRFFSALGVRVELSPRTDSKIVARGNELTAADFCFPMKVFQGHTYDLAKRDGVDYVFLPYLIREEKNPQTPHSYFCPYVQASPSVVRSALRVHGVDASRLLSPVVDFTVRRGEQVDQLADVLCGPLGVDRNAVRKAWAAANETLQKFKAKRFAEGRRFLDDLAIKGEKAVVLIGRPYNTLDLGSNLGLPQKIADLGMRVVPMDMLPYDLEKLNPAWNNMYWAYGQHILAAAELIRNNRNLFAIYFSNFSCGPDSFLLSFVEEVMGEKPFLTLELDEHGGDAGYLTRVEAFFDVIRAWPSRRQPPFRVPEPRVSNLDLRKRKLWIPNMHPVGGAIYAAACRSCGYSAESLPEETRETFDLGRSVTRGSECLPAACTTGAFLDVMKRKNLRAEDQALFMPGASGPCRFGQYAVLQRMILNHLGKGDVAILTPMSENAYGGLSQRLRMKLWQAILAADFILKAACRVRPYERMAGETDRVLNEEIKNLCLAFERDQDPTGAVRRSLARLAGVPADTERRRPLVGIVGEIYVRCNAYSNDHLIRAIERGGGEAWLSPISEWVLYTSVLHRIRARKEPWRLDNALAAWLKNKVIFDIEHRFNDLARPFVGDRLEPSIEDVMAAGAEMVPVEFPGEAILTLGRAKLFAEQGADLVVNVAPFSCMPGTITSALSREIQAETNMPIVSVFYDGEEGMNHLLEVFLAGLKDRKTTTGAVNVA